MHRKITVDAHGAAKIFAVNGESWSEIFGSAILCVLGSHLTDTVLVEVPEAYAAYDLYLKVDQWGAAENKLPLSQIEGGTGRAFRRGDFAKAGGALLQVQAETTGEGGESVIVWQSLVFSACVGDRIDADGELSQQLAPYLQELDGRLTRGVARVELAAGEAEDAQEAAEHALDAAEDARDSALLAWGGAVEARDSALEAASHPPIIGDGDTWYTWDAQAGQYVDTRLPARGRDGQPAPQEAVLYTAQTLTDEQRAQARGNIGAARGGTLTLIEEITVTDADVAEIVRTEEPGGAAYAFEAVLLDIAAPQTDAAQNIVIQHWSGEGVVTAYVTTTLTNATRYIKMLAQKSYGLWSAQVGLYSNTGSVASSYIPSYMYAYAFDAEEIDKIRVSMQSTNRFPVGTVIKIWGVRA